MAKVVEFDKFKVIKESAKEMFDAVGSPGICDNCDEMPSEGYYIAVLNRWFCKKCFERFKRGAKWYPEDALIEDRNFKHYAFCLGINIEQ